MYASSSRAAARRRFWEHGADAFETVMLLTGQGEAFNVGRFILSISPYVWANIGIGSCIGLSVVGAASYAPLPRGHLPAQP